MKQHFKISQSAGSFFLTSLALCIIVFTVQAQDIPRPEHPQPQFERTSWINLNGTWDFTMQVKVENPEENWENMPSAFDRKIKVPFAPESTLSGIGYADFIQGLWYKRSFRIPDNWQGQRIFVNFGGVDFDSRVWINSQLVGRHVGGTGSFEFEITKAVQNGDNEIVVYAYDNTLSDKQPLGKQSRVQPPRWGSVTYTRVSGIC